MAKSDKEGKKLQDELKDSAHRIWLAGLGALSAAEEEGSKVFNSLVERGRDLESKGKEQMGEAKKKAEKTWDTVSGKFDETLTDALHRLGVPTRDEIRSLTEKIEALTAKVEGLKQPKAEPKAAKVPSA